MLATIDDEYSCGHSRLRSCPRGRALIVDPRTFLRRPAAAGGLGGEQLRWQRTRPGACSPPSTEPSMPPLSDAALFRDEIVTNSRGVQGDDPRGCVGLLQGLCCVPSASAKAGQAQGRRDAAQAVSDWPNVQDPRRSRAARMGGAAGARAPQVLKLPPPVHRRRSAPRRAGSHRGHSPNAQDPRRSRAARMGGRRRRPSTAGVEVTAARAPQALSPPSRRTPPGSQPERPGPPPVASCPHGRAPQAPEHRRC